MKIHGLFRYLSSVLHFPVAHAGFSASLGNLHLFCAEFFTPKNWIQRLSPSLALSSSPVSRAIRWVLNVNYQLLKLPLINLGPFLVRNQQTSALQLNCLLRIRLISCLSRLLPNRISNHLRRTSGHFSRLGMGTIHMHFNGIQIKQKYVSIKMLKSPPGLLGFTTGGFFKAGPLVAKHYALVVMGQISLGKYYIPYIHTMSMYIQKSSPCLSPLFMLQVSVVSHVSSVCLLFLFTPN